MTTETMGLDLGEALDEVRNGRGGFKTASHEDVTVLSHIVGELTCGFDSEKLAHLWTRLGRYRDNSHQGVYGEALGAQRDGGLEDVSSQAVAEGALVGAAARHFPAAFLPDEFEPTFTGRSRGSLAEKLYWLDLILTEDWPRLRDWHLAVGIGAACAAETEERLAKHRVSKQVYDVTIRNDAEACQQLLGRVRRRVFPGLRERLDAESRLNTSLGKICAKIPKEELRALIGAMDGKYNFVPTALRRDILDALEKDQALKRGGPDRDLHTLPLSEDVPAKDSGVWEVEILRDQIVQHRELEATLGPGPMRLLTLLMDHPEIDPGEDVQWLAAQLGCSDDTVRNYRKSLKTMKPQILELIRPLPD